MRASEIIHVKDLIQCFVPTKSSVSDDYHYFSNLMLQGRAQIVTYPKSSVWSSKPCMMEFQTSFPVQSLTS